MSQINGQGPSSTVSSEIPLGDLVFSGDGVPTSNTCTTTQANLSPLLATGATTGHLLPPPPYPHSQQQNIASAPQISELNTTAAPNILTQAERDAISRSNITGMLNTVPMFSGEPHTTPINHFIARLEDAALMGNWSLIVLVIIFKQRLVGAALDYFNSNPHFTSANWETLTTAFRKWFHNVPSLDNSLHAFFQCRQKHGESAKLYLTRLKLTGLGSNPPNYQNEEENAIRACINKALLSTFLKGLRDDSGRLTITMHKPRTIDEALALAEEHEHLKTQESRVRAIEETSHMTDLIQLIQYPPHVLTPSTPQVNLAQNSPQNLQREYRPNNNNTITCYRCGGLGHFANTCSTPSNMPRQQALPTFTKPNGYNNASSTQRPRDTISCTYCKKLGHVKLDCRKLKYNTAQRQNQSQNQQQYSGQPNKNQNQIRNQYTPNRNATNFNYQHTAYNQQPQTQAQAQQTVHSAENSKSQNVPSQDVRQTDNSDFVRSST